MKKYIIGVLSLMIFAGCSTVREKAVYDAVTPSPESAEAMTLEEKVGQMLMVRCDSITQDDIEKIQPGGIIMFESDFKELTKSEVKEKIKKLNNLVNISPYIAVDEEGGTVVRVSSNPKLSPEKYESPQYYYYEGGIELVLENAREKSELLTSLGINMNLAPVADVSQDPTHFIYDRTLGKDAKETAEYIRHVVTVMDECNIASCLKHFPGYGGGRLYRAL